MVQSGLELSSWKLHQVIDWAKSLLDPVRSLPSSLHFIGMHRLQDHDLVTLFKGLGPGMLVIPCFLVLLGILK